MEELAIQPDLDLHQATLNVTWSGQNGDLQHPVPYDATDGDIKQIATEVIQAGGPDIPGIDADPDVDFHDFIVDRFPAKDGKPNRLALRPKTPFG